MSCPHSCWPEVKKTLESQAGVAAVELAPQAKEDEINDRTVLIKTSAGFELDKAIAALDKAGFDGAAAK
jgi:copper chaperone CopZ